MRKVHYKLCSRTMASNLGILADQLDHVRLERLGALLWIHLSCAFGLPLGRAQLDLAVFHKQRVDLVEGPGCFR